MLKILTDSVAPWHSYWIRIGQYIEKMGVPYLLTENGDLLKEIEQEDTLIIYRYSESWGDIEQILRSIKNKGVKVITDIDDYLWESRSWTRRRIRGLNTVIKESNIVTVSTKELGEQINVMFKKPVLLFENTGLDLINKEQLINKSRIDVGWTGAVWTRQDDIRRISGVFQWLAQEHETFQLVHVGNSKLKETLAETVNIEEDLVKKIELCGYKEYKKRIKFDIGLAPLSNNTFNRFKSEIKLLEYSSHGIPWIASDEIPYRELCFKWNIKGRLCRSEMEWIKNLEELKQKEVRKREGEKLRYLCNTIHTFIDGVNRWKILLETN